MSAIPAVSKTYFARGNAPFAANGSILQLMQSAVFLLIENLRNTASSGATDGTRHGNSSWAIKGSCDSTATSSSDLIASRTNLVWANAGVARSWWWAENATLGYQIVVDCLNPAANLVIAFAPISAPFSGGTTTARPVSSGEFLWNNTSTGDSSVPFLSDTVTGNSNYAHFCCAEDGQFFFFVTRSGLGLATTFCALQKTAGTSDTRNVFALGHAQISGRGSPSRTIMGGQADGCVGRTPNGLAIASQGGVDRVFPGGYEFFGSGAAGTDAVTGKYNVAALPVWSAQAGQYAYRGILPDLYFVPAVTIGTSIPSTAAQTRVVLGDFIVPFPGIVPLM